MATSKSVTTRVWVSRDCDFGCSKNGEPYAIWRKRPRLQQGSFFSLQIGVMIMDYLCVRDFQKLTGFRLKPGECKQVDMTITMVPVEDTKGGE